MADAKIYKVGISLADKDGRVEDTIRTFDVALYNMYADDVRALIDKFLDTSWVPSIEYGQVRIMHMYDVNYRKGSPWGVHDALIKNGYKHISCFETPFDYDSNGTIEKGHKIILNTASDDIRYLAKMIWDYMNADAADWVPSTNLKRAVEDYEKAAAIRQYQPLEWFM